MRSNRSPAQILSAILRAKDRRAATERAGFEWTRGIASILTLAAKGERSRALSYIDKRIDYVPPRTVADILADKLRRYKVGSRGWNKLARELGRSPADLATLRRARSRKRRAEIFAAWEPSKGVPERVWPEKPVVDRDGGITLERMSEYFPATPGDIRYIEHFAELPWLDVEAVWGDGAKPRPGGSPNAEAGGWRSHRRERAMLPGLLEAAAMIALRAGVYGPVTVRIREYSR